MDVVGEEVWSDAAPVALRANAHRCDPSWRLPPRVLPNYQVWLGLEGDAVLALAGDEHCLRSGGVVIIQPGVSHWGEHDPASPLHCYVLHFVVRVLGATAPEALSMLPTRLTPTAGVHHELVEAAAVMTREVNGTDPGRVLVANAAVARILGLLVRSIADRSDANGPVSVSGGTSRLAAVFAHMVRHHSRQVTLAELSAVAGLSPAHLSHVFRESVGLSPFQYLQRYRLRRAKDLLATTDLTIAAVAKHVGFGDPSYFSRAFRRLEGMTPRQYRELSRMPEEMGRK